MPKPYSIGVDLGGTNLRVALVTREGGVVKKIKEPSTGDVIESLKKAVKSLMRSDVEGIGIGAAGVVDRKERKVIVSPNLPQINGVDFKKLGFTAPVFVENDANAAALGEAIKGAGKTHENSVLLTLGTGVGGGIIYEGKLMKAAAEIGHMSIMADGEKCFCGNLGCLELYCSARAIIAAAAKAVEAGAETTLKGITQGNIYRVTPEEVYKAAMEGDSLSREVLRNAGKYLGVGIANVINIMSPDAVILAGGLIGAWNIYVEEAIKEAGKRAFKSLFQKVSIIPATLGEEAGIVGAASLPYQP
jgi:glucokinase